MGQKRPLQLGAIENSGPNTLVAFLRNAGAGCDRIDIAVAFITTAGLDSLLFRLKQVASQGQVRVLTGLYQAFTEPKALWALLQAQEQTAGQLSVRLSRNRHFHWKAYFLVKKGFAKCVVGSSNLTADGLERSGELNVVLSLATASKEFRQLQSLFGRQWDAQSKPLSAEVVTKYEQWRKQANPVPGPSVPIHKILGRAPKKAKAPTQVRYWRDCIDDYMADETVDLLDQTTNWDQRGYLSFSAWRPTFRPGDLVILFDLIDNSVRAVEIKDTTKTPVRTPDGRHFAACRPVPGFHRRKLVPKRWKELKLAGLLKKKDEAFVKRRISKQDFDLYLEELKKS
jgi:HKD family nuclease